MNLNKSKDLSTIDGSYIESNIHNNFISVDNDVDIINNIPIKSTSKPKVNNYIDDYFSNDTTDYDMIKNNLNEIKSEWNSSKDIQKPNINHT
jgi:hypothetical protein